jgi:predicted transcriptional regulator
MPLRRHSDDLRGRRHDLGIAARDMAAGLGIGLGRLLRMEDGTASEEDKTFYRTWLSRIEGWSAGERNIEMQRVRGGGRFR